MFEKLQQIGGNIWLPRGTTWLELSLLRVCKVSAECVQVCTHYVFNRQRYTGGMSCDHRNKRREQHVKIDEEVGVMHPYTKECQIFLINHQKPEGHGTDSSKSA